jgi:ribose transport system substrate-binding protein
MRASLQAQTFSLMAVGVHASRRHWLLSTLALAACKRSGKRRIAVIPKSTAHMFWRNVEEGALAAGKEFDVEVLWNGANSETDYTRQMQILDSVIAMKVDAIAVAASEKRILLPSIARAMDQKIPVAVFDSGVEGENYTTFLATNNYEGGVMAGRALAEAVGGSGKVGLLMHAPGSASTMDRESGFRDVLKREFPGLVLAAEQFGMGDRARARAAAENILTAHADMRGIFASSEPSSVGLALAINARQLTGKVKGVAFDAGDNLVENLQSGTLQALVAQDPYRIGYESVKVLVDRLNGAAPPKRRDLSAVVIKAGDLLKPENRKLLNLK